MTPETRSKTCRRAGVRLVRFLYCDNGGVIRGRATHVDGLAERISTGIGLTLAMQAMNSLDQPQPVPGMGPVGEVRLVPDPATLVVLPHAPHSAAMVVDHVRLDGQPWEASPRGFRTRMSDRLAERDLSRRCAVENEYSLARPDDDGRMVPTDEGRCFSTIGMAAAATVAGATVAALEAQSISVEQDYAELGHGQQEISCAPRGVVAAADTQPTYSTGSRSASWIRFDRRAAEFLSVGGGAGTVSLVTHDGTSGRCRLNCFPFGPPIEAEARSCPWCYRDGASRCATQAHWPAGRSRRPLYLSGVDCEATRRREAAGADVGLLLQPASGIVSPARRGGPSSESASRRHPRLARGLRRLAAFALVIEGGRVGDGTLRPGPACSSTPPAMPADQRRRRLVSPSLVAKRWITNCW